MNLLPPTWFLIFLLFGIGIHFLFPLYQWLHGYARLLGIVPAAFGGIITIWADQIFKQYRTPVKPKQTPTHLVNHGPFRISRHPMYLGMTCILLGVAVALGSVTALLAPIAFTVCMQLMFVPVEERSMHETFGDSYHQYARRVRQWLGMSRVNGS